MDSIGKIININSRPKNVATEEEISLLFCGLVRLIRSTAIYDINQKLREECTFATKNLNKAQKQIKALQEELEKLKQINEELNKKIASLSGAD